MRSMQRDIKTVAGGSLNPFQAGFLFVISPDSRAIEQHQSSGQQEQQSSRRVRLMDMLTRGDHPPNNQPSLSHE